MKRLFYLSLALLLPATGYGVDEPPAYPFERYQVILDRKPFGDAPAPAPVVAAPPPAAKVEFAKTIKMTGIIEEHDGTIKVGIVDLTNNDSFFLGVGDIEAGVELVSCVYEDEEAIIRKGNEMAVIELQSGEISTITAEEQQQRVQQQQANQSKRLSYAERRRQRQQLRNRPPSPPPQPPPPTPKYTGTELQKHLEEYQMEVIRQGLPALPIPLTPEMDEQLVAEGVLPPVE